MLLLMTQVAVSDEILMKCDGKLYKYVDTFLTKKGFLRSNAEWKEWCNNPKYDTYIHKDRGAKCEIKGRKRYVDQNFYIDFLSKEFTIEYSGSATTSKCSM